MVRDIPANMMVAATTNIDRYDERELRAFAATLKIPNKGDLGNLRLAIKQKQHQILHEGTGVINPKPEPGS